MVGKVVSLLALTAIALSGVANSHEQEVVCYLASWAVYRPGMGTFNIEDVDPSLCTTLIYSFAGLNETTYTMTLLDPEYDINKRALQRFVNLKSLNPRVKVLIAIGGWTEGSTKYSAMAMTRASRKKFIDSAIAFIQHHRLDGLDLDWEYPANRGGAPEDRENFVYLVKELREAFRPYGWMLTAAVAAGKSTIDTAYDIDDLARNLDFLHIMAYDYHGKWDGRTGHNAPLYSREDEPEEEKMLNVASTLKVYLDEGAPPEKLVLGVGFYGRTFNLQDPQDNGIAAPTLTTALAGPYTKEEGFMGYNEICEKQTTEKGLWTLVWQKTHQVPYMIRDNMWIGFDDPISISLKVAYAQKLGLGGVMAWAIDTDDFKGVCSDNRMKYPLLRAINKALTANMENRPSKTSRPIKPSLDDDDFDDKFDDTNTLDSREHDSGRPSRVGGRGGSSVATPAATVVLALLLTSLAAR
ncbi:probable chitinase 2 [Penaeus indicus]|uniref:probable chitinase 2 n=1 Tax=Penaeus indicus TaxID=29960 RepID=UPI00300D6000